jgi:formylglycine-generating enzyme required for sulfatase activity
MFLTKSLHTAAAIAALFLALAMVGCPPPAPGGLAADFRADVTSGAAPLAVQFTDLSVPGASSITSWSWLFGDGGTSIEQDPPHTYTVAGTYNVSLTVTTSEGGDTELKLSFITVTTGGEGEGEGETDTIMLPGAVPLRMVWIPAGTFMMGRYADEQDSWEGEDPRHQVTVPGFWMAKYELTKRQWQAVMGTTPWSGYDYVLDDLDSPAVWVSWDDAKAFITELNTDTGLTFRLPSEAEWEYACRADTTTRFYWGDDPDYTLIDDYAWWWGNTWGANEEEAYAHVVGLKLPNAFGLYDMSGSVWEWCEDDWHSSYTGAPTNGSAWVDSPRGSSRMARGGGWHVSGDNCRSAGRCLSNPSFTRHGFGFRLSR